MIETVFKFIAGVVVAIVIVGVGLNSIKGTPSVELTNKNILAKATLEKQAGEFATCDNSLKLGLTTIYDVSLSYLKYDSTDQEKQQIKDAENGFIAKIKETCDPIITKYKDNFEIYKQTSNDIEKEEMSLFDKLVGRDSALPESAFSTYSPSYVSMMERGADYIFTEQEVKDYFGKQLGLQ